MPITISNPPTDAEDREYPYGLVSLAVSGRPTGGDVAASVAFKVQPYRIDDDTGDVVLHDGPARRYVVSDAFAASATDPALAAAVTTIFGAVQGFVTDKGL